MPALKCTCGAELDFGGTANPISWFLFSEAEQCALPETAGMAEFVKLMKHAVLCPTCARLWIWWSKGTLPVEYVPAALTAATPSESLRTPT
jgi:hypothetical protein